MKYVAITMALLLAACDSVTSFEPPEQGPQGQRGERGPEGKPGPAAALHGYVAMVGAFIPPGESESLYAQCEEGDLLTGGKCVVFGAVDDAGEPRTKLVQEGPVASGGKIEEHEPDGWWGFVRGVSAETEGENAYCYAICVER